MGEIARTQSRAGRLEELKTLLAEREHTTVAHLAQELGVTARTVHRDLAFLRDLGMPVDSDRGRGGGLRLEQGWSLGRVHLSEREAIGLLLSLAIAEKIGSPILLGDSRSIARKIASSFAPAQARRILAVRQRILIGASASPHVVSTYASPAARVTCPLLDSFADRRVVVIDYQDQQGRVTEREVELQFLYYSLPVWYALAWDRLRDDVRAFRIDRITKVHPLPETFRLRSVERFVEASPTGSRPL